MKKLNLAPHLAAITDCRGVIKDLQALAVGEESNLTVPIARTLSKKTLDAIVEVRKSLVEKWKDTVWLEYLDGNVSESLTRICAAEPLEYTEFDVTQIKQYILATVEIEEALTELVNKYCE